MTVKSIQSYKLGDVVWRPECFPHEERLTDVLAVLTQQTNINSDTIQIQMKGNCFHIENKMIMTHNFLLKMHS